MTQGNIVRFEASALTHMLVVADAVVSRDWYVDVLDASVYGEYGGTSVVLNMMVLGCSSSPAATRPRTNRP